MSFNLFLQSLGNSIGFYGRSWMRWSRPGYQEIPESKDNLFAGFEHPEVLEAREKLFCQTYDLSGLRERSGRMRYLENLTILTFLEQLQGGESLPETVGPLRWLDVGAKNWAYLDAIAAFLKKRTDDFRIHGIELDGYRLYPDFHSRSDYARTFCEAVPQATYEVGDVMRHHEQYDVITWILPFVFPEPCLAWGLPLGFFRPEEALSHVLSLLNPGGVLWMINQGEQEHQAQGKLLKSLLADSADWHFESTGMLEGAFLSYRYPRYGWRCFYTPAVLRDCLKIPQAAHGGGLPHSLQ